MKIFMIGWFGSGNMGDEAILISELLYLKKKISGVEFYILSFNPERTKKLTAKIPEVKKILRIESKQHVIKSDFSGIFKAFREVDAVIIGGGGIFQDIYNYYPIPFFTMLSLLASINKKKSLLYSVGIGPINTFIGRRLCRLAACSVDMISVRDPESLGLLKGLGVSKHVYLSADPVFLLEPVMNEKVRRIIKKNHLDGGGLVIGVCVQDLLFWSDENRQILADILDTLATQKGAKIVCLPLGAYKDSWISSKTFDTVDMTASKKLMNRMIAKPAMIIDELTPQELLALMGDMDLIISMRLHGLIMGLTMGIPVIALTYSVESKIRNLMNRIDQTSSLFDVNNLEKEKLITRIEYWLSGPDDVKIQLIKAVLTLKNEAEKNNTRLINALTHST